LTPLLLPAERYAFSAMPYPEGVHYDELVAGRPS
jgi:hypothetical protein